MFQTIFRMAVAGRSRSDRRWQSLPVSLALHGVVLAFVAILSSRAVKESLEPPAPMVFLQGSAPPLPPGDTEPAATHSKEEVVPVTLKQPEQIKAETETSPATTDDPLPEGGDAPAKGEIAGDPNGKKDGVATGLPDSDGRQGTRAGDSTRPFVPGGDVTEPRLLERVEPGYPESARKARLEGTVLLQAIIGVTGRVEEVQVVHSANAILDAAAVRAVEQWRYRPATLTGRPVRVYLTVTVEFKLR